MAIISVGLARRAGSIKTKRGGVWSSVSNIVGQNGSGSWSIHTSWVYHTNLEADSRRAKALSLILQVYFSDECHFHQNSRHTDWAIRNKHERTCPDCMLKRRRSVASQFSVWAMVAVGYKSKLVFFQETDIVEKKFKNGKVKQQPKVFGGSLTQERYVNEVLPIVRERKQFLSRKGESMIFQEDNDNSHGTRSYENRARYAKIEMDLDFIEDWSANSPDLNPIENVWRILKSRIKLHHSQSAEDVRHAIEREWELIEQWEIDECILGSARGVDRGKGGKAGKDCHMWNRIEQCIERNGLSTEF